MSSDKKKNDAIKKSYHQEIKDKTKQGIELFKLINNETRLRLILLLLINQKISLSSLSVLLNRTKGTVLHHLKKLDNLGFIKTTRREPLRGYIEANIYELVPNFYDFFNILTINDENLKKLGKKMQSDILHYAILKDRLIIQILINIFKLTSLFHQGLDINKAVWESDSFEDYLNFYFHNRINYKIYFLSEKKFKLYKALVKDFNSQIKEILKESQNQDSEKSRGYFVLNTFFPIKKISEYDPNSEEFRRFFEYLS